MIRKTVRNLVAPLAIVLGAMAVFAVPAAASGTGCVFKDSAPRSCVQVKGASLHVDWAGGGVNLAPRQSARGHFRVYDTKREFRPFISLDRTYWNQSWFHTATFWGPKKNLNRVLPKGDQICASFVERRGPRIITHSPACVTVHV